MWHWRETKRQWLNLNDTLIVNIWSNICNILERHWKRPRAVGNTRPEHPALKSELCLTKNETTASLVLEKLSNTPIHLSTDPSLRPDAFNQICKKKPNQLEMSIHLRLLSCGQRILYRCLQRSSKKLPAKGFHNRTSAAVHYEPLVAEWHWQQLVDTAAQNVAATFSATDSVRASIAVPASVDRPFMQECGETRQHTRDRQNLRGGTAPIPRADRRLKTQISRRCNQVLITCFVLAKKNVHSCAATQSTPNPSCAVR